MRPANVRSIPRSASRGSELRPFPRQPKGGPFVQGLAKQTAVVVHRYPLWRDALRDILVGLGFNVLTETDSADEAVSVVESAQPDLIVVGAALSSSGDTKGIDCVQQARNTAPKLRAAVLTESYDQAEADAALAAGAYAYIVETAHPDDIRAAIRQGFQTSVFLNSGETEEPARPAPPRVESYGLTKREREILRLVSEGHSNGEVAGKLWVTEQTVKFHLSNIYRKLGVANRTEAGRWAQITGLLDNEGQESVTR
jgi:DNA-binding NarL/FixJ family response regulator